MHLNYSSDDLQIPPELISMDNSILGDVDTETLQKALENQPQHIKKADIELKHRLRRKNAKIPKIKEAIRIQTNLQMAKNNPSSSNDLQEKDDDSSVPPTSNDPLSRFVKKKKK